MFRTSVTSRTPSVWLTLALIVSTAGCSENPITVDELIITDIVVGDGNEAITGKSVGVHYTGWIYDWTESDGRGARFDSSHDRGIPFNFAPGGGTTIKGWEVGVPGMRAGGKRELLIPSTMAYGERGGAGGKIPPNSDLLFEIELILVRD
ncbi:MAG: FKBP-type peptidyl-prolyl cis-trans isomerase [Myxococcota bacterium]